MTQSRRTVSLGIGAGLAASIVGGASQAAGKTERSSGMTQVGNTPDLATRVAALDARRAIEERRSIYGGHAARGDAKGVASCFTEDCVYDGPAGGPGKRDTVHTRKALEEYLAARLKPGAQIPFLYNHIIKVDGDAAEGSCAINPHVTAGDKPMVGYYVEKLRKVDGQWLFADRRFYLYQPYLELDGAA
jgi:hypothetical protein